MRLVGLPRMLITHKKLNSSSTLYYSKCPEILFYFAKLSEVNFCVLLKHDKQQVIYHPP